MAVQQRIEEQHLLSLFVGVFVFFVFYFLFSLFSVHVYFKVLLGY